MNISELKKLIKKLGGLLVMDGEDPSFVMLSYENYNELAEDGAKVVVHKEESMTHIGVADYSTADSPDAILTGENEQFNDSEEDRINQLNQEIAMLKSEIKQRETELSTQDLE